MRTFASILLAALAVSQGPTVVQAHDTKEEKKEGHERHERAGRPERAKRPVYHAVLTSDNDKGDVSTYGEDNIGAFSFHSSRDGETSSCKGFVFDYDKASDDDHLVKLAFFADSTDPMTCCGDLNALNPIFVSEKEEDMVTGVAKFRDRMDMAEI